MKKYLQIIPIILATMMACKSSKVTTKKNGNKDLPIAHLGSEPVYTSEFLYVYEKNNKIKKEAYTESSIRDYLDLFLKFKLKVLDAHQQGIDTTKLFKTELSGYEYQLAKPYLNVKEVNDKLVKETYDRMKEEISASHILLRISPDAAPDDTLRLYNQLKALKAEIQKGNDFNKIAQKYSQDPSAKNNKGYLGYFTALQMVYPFEDAAYNTSKGKVSDIFRTDFGYHLIKVHDRRATKGKVKIAHIMLQTAKGISSSDSIRIAKKIYAIHQKLIKGGDWNLLCQQHSEHSSSKKNNGDLPPFPIGTHLKNFENTAFALQKPGDYSKPIKTPYGWHIIKLIKKINLEPFDKIKPLLEQKINKDSRSEVGKRALLEKLHKENHLKVDKSILDKVLLLADTSLTSGRWTYKKSPLLKETILSFENDHVSKAKNILAKDFMEYVTRKQKARKDIKDPKHYMKTLFENYKDKATLLFEKEHLADKYEDYRMLAKEYKESMMLFKMMTKNVWGKGIKDTVGARQYYKKHSHDYQWGNRISATIFDGANAKVIQRVKSMKEQKRFVDPDFKMPNIFFKKNSVELPSESLQSLNRLTSYLLQDKRIMVEIGGYIDPLEKKPNLSINRAKTITNYLVKRDIPIQQIIQKDYGKYKPLSRTDRSKNSRAGFTIYSTNIQTLAKIMNIDNPLNLKISKGDFQKGDNSQKIINEIVWKKGEQQFQRNGRTYLVIIDDIKQSRNKTFQEAKGNVIQDYQKYLEKNWIQQLESKYPVKIHEEVLQSIIKVE